MPLPQFVYYITMLMTPSPFFEIAPHSLLYFSIRNLPSKLSVKVKPLCQLLVHELLCNTMALLVDIHSYLIYAVL